MGQCKNPELPRLSSERNSSYDEPRVSHENQYFGSYAPTGDSSGSKKTQNYAPTATPTATTTSDKNRVFGNQTNSSQHQKPVARCSPIMIQSNQNNNNNSFSSNNNFIPSPPLKPEKLHSTPQQSPPQKFQPDV